MRRCDDARRSYINFIQVDNGVGYLEEVKSHEIIGLRTNVTPGSNLSPRHAYLTIFGWKGNTSHNLHRILILLCYDTTYSSYICTNTYHMYIRIPKLYNNSYLTYKRLHTYVTCSSRIRIICFDRHICGSCQECSLSMEIQPLHLVTAFYYLLLVP